MKALGFVAIFLAQLVAPAAAAPGWTFCVAEGGEHDIWITGVFAAAHDRERLEADFKAWLRGHGVAGAVAQCPAPKDDRTDMVNAALTAAQFHRKLGDTLHEVLAPEFDPRR